MIEEGKRILKNNGLNTNIFFAPAHSYDKNTVLALRENGFKIMSDGRSYYPYNWLNIKFIPVRYFGLDIKQHNGIFTIALHPSKCTNFTFIKLERFMESNTDEIYPYEDIIDEECKSFIKEMICEKTMVLKHRYVMNTIDKCRRGIHAK